MRIIQVGTGKMGQHWLDVLKARPGLELVGIVEPVAALREAAVAKIGLDPANAFAALDDAITGVAFDAAAVVTPPATHRPISEQLLRAGKHVVQEKPLATTAEDAAALEQVAAETGKTLMVAQNYRHFGAYRTVKSVLDSGRVGKVVSLDINFQKQSRTMFGEGDFRYQMAQPLLVDMAIHHFDIARGLLGADADSVYAKSWHVPDGHFAGDAAVTAVFSMSGGVVFSYQGNWATYREETSWNGVWEIVGEHGRMVLAGGEWDSAEVTFQAHGGEVETIPTIANTESGHDSVVSAFVEAVAAGRQPETNASDNVKSLAMVLSAVASAESGEVVHLER